MQPVHAGGSIIRGHDRSQELLAPIESPRRGVGYCNILLLPNDSSVRAAVLLLPVPVRGGGSVSYSPLRPAATLSPGIGLLSQAFELSGSKRILLHGELVDKIARITPKRELRPGVVVLVVEAGGRAPKPLPFFVLLLEIVTLLTQRSTARGGREGVQRDVGGLACATTAAERV